MASYDQMIQGILEQIQKLVDAQHNGGLTQDFERLKTALKIYKGSMQHNAREWAKCGQKLHGVQLEVVNLKKQIWEMEQKLVKLEQFDIPAPQGKKNIDNKSLTEILKPLGGALYLSDRQYKLVAKSEIKRFLAQDKTDLLNYVSEYFDCDDFAYRLMGQFSMPGWAELAFGIAWGNFPKPHAINLFVDGNKKVWFIEPQNDEIKEKGEDWEVWLIMM